MRDPSLSVDEAVHAIWTKSLGRKAGRDGDNILDLQVGVRRIMRMIAEIEATTGHRVAPSALLRLGTAKALADAIRTGAWPEPSPFLQLKAGRDAPPLYLVSAGGGFVIEQAELARSIDHDGPVIGLQMPGIDGEEAPLDRVEAIARHYVDHIVARQAAGPYHIAGYSFGGLVALEMARALRDAGARLGLVALIDSNLNERHWPRDVWLGYLARRAATHGRALRRQSPREAVATAVALLQRLRDRLRRHADAPGAAPTQSAYHIPGLPDTLQKVREASIAAFERYDPPPFDGPVTLIKSAAGDPHSCDPRPVWRRKLRNLTVTIVDGSHTNMIRAPHYHRLAAEISTRLARCSGE